MVSPGLELGRLHLVTVSTSVTIRELNWLTEHDPGLEAEAFHEALDDTIRLTGAFAALSPSDAADYLLEVHIEQVRHPSFAMTMQVSITAQWTLTVRGGMVPVLTEGVESQAVVPYEATFNGYERRRLAVESAARANIEEGLRRIARVNLGS